MRAELNAPRSRRRHSAHAGWDGDAHRGDGNVAFVHYNDLETDLAGEMWRMAAFLGIEVPESKWPAAVPMCATVMEESKVVANGTTAEVAARTATGPRGGAAT